MSINELQKGDEFLGFALLRGFEFKLTTTGKPYADMTLCDTTGNINGKMWDVDEAKLPNIQKGQLVKVRGKVDEFKGQLQLRMDRIRPVTDTDNVNIADFVPSAPQAPQEMYDFLLKAAKAIQKEGLRTLTLAVLSEYKDKLLIYPAAEKMHHAVRGGLLQHTLTMLQAGQALLAVYKNLNADLLTAGVILHDFAKMDELSVNDTGLVENYSKQGLLLGHLVQGVAQIARIGAENGVDAETILLLQHMILSHHYMPEHGSPRYPMFPEAEVLHYLDIMDARLYEMDEALQGVEKGSFSERVWALDNRSLYQSELK